LRGPEATDLQPRHAILNRDTGADDYIIKPFDIEELCARIQALLRRTGGSRAYETRGLLFDPQPPGEAPGRAIPTAVVEVRQRVRAP
jgi:DNA-binding response OmpR family regulator